MEALPCLIFPVFVALAVAAIVFGIMQSRRRREQAAKLAARLGFDYYVEDPWGMPSRYEQFGLFQHGHSKRAGNVLVGEAEGRAVVAFEYRYTTGSGKNSTTHHYQAAVIEMPIVAPRLRMRPEGFFDRVASWVGYDDLDFESDEFSRRYHVRSDDRRFAYDILHARLIEQMLSWGQAPSMELSGPIMLVYDKRGDVLNLKRLIDVAAIVIRSFPDYVLAARGASPSGGPR